MKREVGEGKISEIEEKGKIERRTGGKKGGREGGKGGEVE
jgi:hypothetical protein